METDSGSRSATDATAIAAVPARMVATWARHDGHAFAELFADDGVMFLPGTGCFGKDSIEKFMTTAFAGRYKGTSVVGSPLGMRILSPQTVVLFTEGGVIGPGQNEPTEVQAIRATWVLVKQDTDWKVQAYQNCPANS